jgi:BNR repeat-like domain/Glycosyl hydrolase-like 10
MMIELRACNWSVLGLAALLGAVEVRATDWVKQAAEDAKQDRTAIAYDGKTPNKLVCDTTLRELADGSWALFMLAGDDFEPSPKNYIGLTRSSDGGKTWSPLEPVNTGFSREGKTSGQGPSEVMVRGNRSTLFFSTHSQTWGCDWKSWMMFSLDGCRTWSRSEPMPGRLADFTFIRNHIVTRDERILVPFQHYLGPPAGAPAPEDRWKRLEFGVSNPRNGVLMSSDGGKTWTEHGAIRLTTDDRYHGWAENNIVELSDGRIAMIIRGDRLGGVLYYAESKDGGRTWPEFATKTDIPNPGSKATLYPLGGDTVGILHNPNPKHRSPLALWISFDGMKTWPYRRVLVPESSDGPKGRLNYPDGFVSKDKQWLHFAFDDNRHRAVYYGAKLPPVKEKRRLVLCNDGGTLGAPDMEAPIGVEGLVHETIDPLRDTMVDTLYWQLGADPYWGTQTHRLSDWYLHNTKIGAIWGSDRDKFKTAGEWRLSENAHQMMKQGIDPAAVVIEQGHKAGLDIFLSLRVNDGHDSRLPDGAQDINLAPLRRQHPEWLINGAGYNKFIYNFAVPAVREYTVALIEEAIANYDLDGFDIDFCRQPTLFKPRESGKAVVDAGTPRLGWWSIGTAAGEAGENGSLITGMMRQIRRALDTKSRKAGRKLFFSVRVPPSLELDRLAGMDVTAWVKDRLVDIVVIGDPNGWNYRLPVEEFREVSRGTDCKILAQNLCAYKEDRGRSAAVLFGERNYYSTEQFRAVAARHWMAGADGIFLWNQHFLKFDRDDRFDRQSWKEVADPQVLARKSKHYLVGPQGRGGSLPVNLACAGDSAEINVEIADDLASARNDGVSCAATLRLLIEQLTVLDKIELQLDGVPLDVGSGKKRLNYNDCWLDFDVSKTLRRGINRLVVKVGARNPHVLAPLAVRSVETLVWYGGQ